MLRNIVLSALFLLLCAASPARAAPVAYRLDPVHCQVLFFVDHLGFSRQLGRFTGVEGRFAFDPAGWDGATVEAQIAVDSLWLGDAPWQRKMLSADFFNAAEHPTMRFVSERVEATGENTARVHGNLTLLGVSRPVVLEVVRNRVGRNTFNLKHTAGFSARTTIKRSAFGMRRMLAAVGDEIEIVLEIEGIRE